jgi:hypothetical protein
MDSINQSPRDTFSPTQATKTGPTPQIVNDHRPESIVNFLRHADLECVLDAFDYGWGLTMSEKYFDPQAKAFETIKQDALSKLPESEKNEVRNRFNDEVSIGLVKLMNLPAQVEQDYAQIAGQDIAREEKREKVCAWKTAQQAARFLTQALTSCEEIHGALCISWQGVAGHHPFFSSLHEKARGTFMNELRHLDKCSAADGTILFNNAVRAHLAEQMPLDFQERYYAIVNQPHCANEEIESQISTFLGMPTQQEIVFHLELSAPMRHAFPSSHHPDDNK